MGKKVLELLEKPEAIIPPLPKPVSLTEVDAKLTELLEQSSTVDFTPVQTELTDVSLRLERCEAQLALIVSMLQSKMDLDVQEQEIMALMKAKIEKG